jgi:transposase
MDVISPRCCGLDIHQKTVVACLMTSEAGQLSAQTPRTFRTMTADLLALADWLHAAGCTHVAMESTGVSWRPIDNILAGLLTLLVVNAQPMKAVPGRTTEVKDAA